MVHIRPALPEEAGTIAGIQISSWQTTYRGLMPEVVLENLSFGRQRDWWSGELSGGDHKVLVAEAGGKLVGFASYGPERESDPLYEGELYTLYLLQGYQRKGLGRDLFRAAAQGLMEAGMNAMLVWVLSTNPARRFYEYLGGVYLKDKPVKIGGADLVESAYGWDDLSVFDGLK